jgi:DNA-binding transcriptional LysR family regulator
LRVGLGSGPGAMLMTPWLVHMARHFPSVKVAVTRGATELQLLQLRERQLDALVVDVRRVVPAADIQIETLVDMPAGFVCRRGHPLLARGGPVPFDELLAYPIAATPLSDEVARIMVAHYGPKADPAQMTTLRCEEIASLLDTVEQTDAVYLGILGAARSALVEGRLIELAMSPPFRSGARLGLVTMTGRTELPVMQEFRNFVRLHLSDVQEEGVPR